jgi:hypothetical protein
MQLALGVLDRRADRDELGELSSPLVSPDLEPNADDAAAPSESASSSIRVIASSRAWYIACVSTSSSWFLPQRRSCRPMW